jgi:hypothetical protein
MLGRTAKWIALQVLGWLLVLLGIAALVLPGPGLILLFCGLAVLSQQYEWAERRAEPVKRKAYQGAEQSVATWFRIGLTFLGGLWLTALGVLFVLSPEVPDWWSLRESWWLPGGWATGASLLISGAFVFGTLLWSYRHFRVQQD